MRNVFSFIATAALLLAVPAKSGAATLVREEAKDAPPSAHGLSETNAQLVVGIAGLSLLPEKDAGAATAGDIHAGAEIFAGHGGADGELMLAFLRSLHRANARASFVVAATKSAADSSGGESAGELVASGEALDEIYSMQQSGVVAVPEPSTYALLGAGAALLAFKARRRR